MTSDSSKTLMVLAGVVGLVLVMSKSSANALALQTQQLNAQTQANQTSGIANIISGAARGIFGGGGGGGGDMPRLFPQTANNGSGGYGSGAYGTGTGTGT